MDLVKEVYVGPVCGRGLIATRTINPGELVFSEDPLICCQFSWNKLYGYRACDHCLCPLETVEENARRLTNNPGLVLPCINVDWHSVKPVCCPKCSTLYCSNQCLQDAASIYHSALCLSLTEWELQTPLRKLDEIWRQVHYPPETSTIFLLVRIVGACLSANLLNSSNSQLVIDVLKSFVSDTVVQCFDETNGINKLCHKLLGDQFVVSLQLLHDAFVEVLYYLCEKVSLEVPNLTCMELLHNSGLNNLLEKQNFVNALCLIGRNGQGIATSVFSMWAGKTEKSIVLKQDSDEMKKFEQLLDHLYHQMEEHVGSFLDNEGVGLYRYQSLINHSCQPNCVVQFTGFNSRLSIVAVKSIEENEEITISYLDPCLETHSRHTRRKFLSSNYLFLCNCIKCEMEKESGSLSQTSSDDESEDCDDCNKVRSFDEHNHLNLID